MTTGSTETRISLAEADVNAIDTTDLSIASNAELIGLLIRSRGSLVDLIRMHREWQAETASTALTCTDT